MGKVKCDYCDGYIDDTQEYCPTCGAPNAGLVRTADKTPRTIEELQQWYADRKLPPEEVTRFFIGKNIREPKAFGIYRDGENVIVYKNKADGTRAVRYKGKDEAYGVNELFLRLKEEILNQKNANAAKSYAQGSPASRSAQRAIQPQRKRLGCGALMAIAFFVFNAVIFGAAGISLAIERRNPQANCYYYNDSCPVVYYESGLSDESGVEWWYYGQGFDDWQVYGRLGGKEFPEGTEGKDYHDAAEFFERYGTSIPSVTTSKLYADFYHSEPAEGYYESGGSIYYYLNDKYGDEFGDGSNSGWYVYDDGWDYYCAYDDRGSLSDDLWYDPDSGSIGSSYSDFYIWSTGAAWVDQGVFDSGAYVTEFEDTSWYAAKEDAYDGYVEYLTQSYSESSSSSSSDSSSWDWDSSSDWDSGSSDWDSDW